MERTFKPEAKYFFNAEQVTEQRIQNAYMSGESITGKVVSYDEQKRTVKVFLGKDLVGILPWNEATIYKFTYPKISELINIPRQIIALLNKTIQVKVVGIVKGEIHLSRRINMLEALENILKEEDKVREAVVVGKYRYGVFFDIGHGVIAFCHIKDYSTTRILNASTWIAFSEKHKVALTTGCDYENNYKIGCSRKAAYMSEKDFDYYKPGQIVTAKIAEPVMQDGTIIGYFAELSPNVAGIVDIVDEYNGFRAGDVVTVLIKKVNAEARKIKMRAIL